MHQMEHWRLILCSPEKGPKMKKNDASGYIGPARGFISSTSTKWDTLMVLGRQHEVVCRLDEGALLLLLSCY